MNRIGNISILLVIICAICCKFRDNRIDLTESSKTDSSIQSNIGNPKDTNFFEMKGELAFQGKRYDSAIIYYSILIHMAPQKGEYYFRRGICHAQLNSDTLAILDFNIAIRKNYATFDVYRVLGVMHMFNKQRAKQALFYFEKCLEIKPDDEEIKSFIKEVKNLTSN